MTRLYLAASFALILLMLTFAPAQGGSRTAPATNTPRPRVEIALVPSLTPAPCPEPVEVHEVINGVAYSGLLTAVCQ